MPFFDEGAEPALQKVLANGNLTVSSDPKSLGISQYVVCVIGTPVDEFLNPKVHDFFNTLDVVRENLKHGQILILRSTLFPQTSKRVQHLFDSKGPKIDVAVCPERVAQGKGYQESKTLPQIVSGFSERGKAAATFLFEQMGVEIIEVEPLEAELIKLFNNVYRYVTFAVANQFYTITSDYGIDYYRVHHALTYKYPRGAHLPAPGFAAGPCLFKDTMQLAAFSNDRFFLGHAAMMVNEGLPLYVVHMIEEKFDLSKMTVGILGLSFKANCDDIRDSLAFKLRKILKIRAKRVLCSDHHVSNEVLLKHVKSLDAKDICTTQELIEKSDLIILGVPHREYHSLDLRGKPVLDVWNCLGKGALI